MSVPPSVLVDKIAGYAPSCIGNCGCDCRQIGYSSRSRRRLVYIVLLYRYRSYWELCSALFLLFGYLSDCGTNVVDDSSVILVASITWNNFCVEIRLCRVLRRIRTSSCNSSILRLLDISTTRHHQVFRYPGVTLPSLTFRRVLHRSRNNCERTEKNTSTDAIIVILISVNVLRQLVALNQWLK